jgi:two-component system, OmpR family, copper resistance phosphate regulon response regulator CusR
MPILVAEDERKIADFIKRGLEEEGFAVDTVADGEQAVAYASSGTYDAIILDVMMPKLDGFAVCRALREQDVSAPVLMLTVKEMLEDKMMGFQSGADDYLTKPFAFEELVARVRALLRRSHAVKPSVLRIADLSLDPSSRKVTRNGRSLELTGREYQLLYFLLQHAGAVQTRTVLLNSIWGYDFDGNTNVLEAYIRLLRRKIDAGHRVPLLRTVRGVGYVLRE